MVKYIMQELQLRDDPQHQNIPQAVNHMMKEQNNFVPQDDDKFVISSYNNFIRCVTLKLVKTTIFEMGITIEMTSYKTVTRTCATTINNTANGALWF